MVARLDNWTKRRILELREKNLSTALIAERLGVHKETVKRYSKPQKVKEKERPCYSLRSPAGEIHQVENLKRFASLHGLHSSGFHRIIKGIAKKYRGWMLVTD